MTKRVLKRVKVADEKIGKNNKNFNVWIPTHACILGKSVNNNNLPDMIIDLDELFATSHVVVVEVKSRRVCFLLTYRCRVENKSLREFTPAMAIPAKLPSAQCVC